MVRFARDYRVAVPSAMIHLLPYTPWIMAVLSCQQDTAAPKSVTVREIQAAAERLLSLAA